MFSTLAAVTINANAHRSYMTSVTWAQPNRESTQTDYGYVDRNGVNDVMFRHGWKPPGRRQTSQVFRISEIGQHNLTNSMFPSHNPTHTTTHPRQSSGSSYDNAIYIQRASIQRGEGLG